MATVSKTQKPAAQPMSLTRMLCIMLILVLFVLIGLIGWHCGQARALQSCDPQNLTLTAGQQSGAAGTIYQHMIVTNTGNKKCRMTGFPAAFLYGSSGYAVGSAAAARPSPVPVNVVLAHGQTANTVLGYPQAGNFNPGVCSAASTNLDLYVPGATMPLVVSLAVPWCPGFSESSMQPGN